MHKHRAIKGEVVERCFGGAIYHAIRENPKSHGNITRTNYCQCGAIRKSNHNQGQSEYGPWMNYT